MDPFEITARDLDELALAPVRAASRVAPRLGALIAEQHAAGVAPDGSAWAPDARGGVARIGALGAPVVTASGAAITIELPDTMLPHQAGVPSRGLPRRQVLPTPAEAIPDPYLRIIDAMLGTELGGDAS